jgi:CO dehydrogenase/acetyl-CoA synthase beta subunit
MESNSSSSSREKSIEIEEEEDKEEEEEEEEEEAATLVIRLDTFNTFPLIIVAFPPDPLFKSVLRFKVSPLFRKSPRSCC